MARNAFERQEIASIFVDLTPADIAGGGFTANMPQACRIIAVAGEVETAFNTGGTTPACTFTLTDGTTNFINAQSVLAAGTLTAAATKKYLPVGGTLTGTFSQSAASGMVPATAGLLTVRIDYVQLGRQVFNQG